MKRSVYFVAFMAAIALSGCLKQETENPGGNGDQGGSIYFDFATTKVHDLSISYDLQAIGYAGEISFVVYTEDPDQLTTKSVGGETYFELTRKDIEPIFRANTVNHGTFNGKIQLPSGVKNVWVCTDYPGLPSKLQATVTVQSVLVSNSAPLRSSRALTTGLNHTYPDYMYPIDGKDDWDGHGVPSYLNPSGSRKTLPEGLLSDIRGVLPEARSLDADDNPHKYLIQPNVSHDIKIKGNTTMDMVFLNDGAVLTSVTGYYVYPTATPPTSPDDISKLYIAFPNASAENSYGKLVPGDYVHLKYINGAGDWTDQFEEGMSIGFFIFVHGFDAIEAYGNSGSGNIREMHWSNYKIHYSDPKLNYYYWHNDAAWASWQKQQTVALYDYKSGRDIVVIGFEDMSNGGYSTSGDRDFNDVMFYIQASPSGNIDVPGDRDDDLEPNPDPDPKGYELEYSGTLAFEDLWPFKGDYDLNDVGITYYSKVYYNAKNEIYKSEDVFTPVCKGGKYANGFGFQYGVDVSKVTGSTLAATNGAPAHSFYSAGGSALEPGQTKATVMLFDDIDNQVSNNGSNGKDKSKQLSLYSYTVTTTYDNVSAAELGFPPYNPFIVIKPSASSDPRGRETHLPNYQPTEKATQDDTWKYFGYHDDRSDKISLWYVSDAGFPWAINIPSGSWKFPNEMQRVDAAYPRFNNWVRTSGAQDADWWKDAKK